MGCGQKAAAMEREEQSQIERIARLKRVTPGKWDTFLDEVERLTDSIERGDSILRIAHHHRIVTDGLKHIRRDI